MKVKDLKEWLDTIPEEYEKYDIVFRTVTTIDEDYWTAKDEPIWGSGVDDANKELFLCSTESEDLWEKMMNDSD